MERRLLNDKESKPLIEKIKDKFPIAKCREVLERKGRKFTEEQIVAIRNFLISISRVAYQTFQKQIHREVDMIEEPKNIIEINKEKQEEEREFKEAA